MIKGLCVQTEKVILLRIDCELSRGYQTSRYRVTRQVCIWNDKIDNDYFLYFQCFVYLVLLCSFIVFFSVVEDFITGMLSLRDCLFAQYLISNNRLFKFNMQHQFVF